MTTREGYLLQDGAPDKVARSIAAGLRSRADALRRAAKFNLGLIVVALVAGVGLFLYAGELANREAQAVSKQFADLGVRVEFLAQEVSRIGIAFPNDSSDKAAPASQISLFEKVTKAVDLLRGDVQNARKELLDPSDGNDRYRLISTVSTRIGSVLILVFLVQILVGLYRYNMRLAAYYDARADALHVLSAGDSNLDIEGLRRLTLLWSPDQIGFGKEPQSLIDAAVEAARKLGTQKDEK